MGGRGGAKKWEDRVAIPRDKAPIPDFVVTENKREVRVV